MKRILMAVSSPENEIVGEYCASLMVVRRYEEDEYPEYIVHGLTWDQAQQLIDLTNSDPKRYIS